MSYFTSPQFLALADFWREPDTFDSTMSGLSVCARRNSMKAWCGYVGVPTSHALFRKGYDARIAVPDRGAVSLEKTSPIIIFLEALNDDDGAVSLSCLINVHGGLTYAKEGWPKDDGLWYFGFDCSHYNDLTPKQVFMASASGVWTLSGEETYRNLDYVEQELTNMASQLELLA